MPRDYVKVGRRSPWADPQTEREFWLDIAWNLGITIAGAELEETSYLRDLVQWQISKIKQEPAFKKGHITEGAKQALREYHEWANRKGY